MMEGSAVPAAQNPGEGATPGQLMMSNGYFTSVNKIFSSWTKCFFIIIA